MRKKILMIGNSNQLPGVPVDLADFYDFFTSPEGGNWCGNEIEVLKNPSRRSLFQSVEEIAEAEYDYLITFFTGHGNEDDDETVLCINEREEIVLSNLTNLSPKQLNIIHCCRCYAETSTDRPFMKARRTRLSISRNPIRRAYEKRIQDCSPEQIILYSCEDGEITSGTYDGGNYLQSLLDATHAILAESDTPFVSVAQAHHEAVALTRQDGSRLQQRPQIHPSSPSIHPYPLPWAINPDFV